MRLTGLGRLMPAEKLEPFVRVRLVTAFAGAFFCGHASLAQDAATPDASGVVALPEVDVEEGGGGRASASQIF